MWYIYIMEYYSAVKITSCQHGWIQRLLILNEMLDRDRQIPHGMDSKKAKQTKRNKTKQKQTHRNRDQRDGYQKGGVGVWVTRRRRI